MLKYFKHWQHSDQRWSPTDNAISRRRHLKGAMCPACSRLSVLEDTDTTIPAAQGDSWDPTLTCITGIINTVCPDWWRCSDDAISRENTGSAQAKHAVLFQRIDVGVRWRLFVCMDPITYPTELCTCKRMDPWGCFLKHPKNQPEVRSVPTCLGPLQKLQQIHKGVQEWFTEMEQSPRCAANLNE